MDSDNLRVEDVLQLMRENMPGFTESNVRRDGATGELFIRLDVTGPAQGDEFVWQKLHSPTQFRLLGLRAKRNAQGVSEPEWMLRSFDMSTCPPYTALSYTWGDQKFSEPLSCDGKVILVTKTVWNFLHEVYAPNWMKTLDPEGSRLVCIWIDAICIDQNNAQEKSAQVRIIGDIFSRAVGVICWLGDNTPERLRALEFLGGLKVYFDDMYTHNETGDIDSVMEMKPYREMVTADDLMAVSRFLGHPYFSRTWIVQEVAVAKKLNLQIGPLALSWETFIEVCERIAIHPAIFGGFSFATDMLLVQKIRQLHNTRRLSLIELLSNLERFKSYDPRDKIFAVIGISKEKDHGDLQPDYLQKTEELYHDFAVFALQEGLAPHILASVTPRSSYRLPSWVPDWSRTDRNLHGLVGHSYRAGGPDNAVCGISVDQSCLAFQGKVIDEIETLIPTPNLKHASAEDWLSPANVDNIPQLLEIESRQIYDWIKACDDLASVTLCESSAVKEKAAEKSPPASELWRVLICDRTGDRREAPPEYAQYLESYRRHLEVSQGSPAAGYPGAENVQMWQVSMYREALTSAMEYRVLTSTKSMRLAVVPDAAAIGDVLCVFEGIGTPVALRRQENGHFRIIGEAYVHGVMQGEAMSDPRVELCNIVVE